MVVQVISVNIGRERPITIGRQIEETGIYKTPAVGPVMVGWYGPAGDTIVDKKHHGGLDQAVYVYGAEDYAWWAGELGRELGPGTFGENLTIAGLESAIPWQGPSACAIGDHIHAGAAILEVSAPRIPCSTLAARLGDPSFVKRFRHAGRPGLYCRVIREGRVTAGDPASVTPFPGPTISVLEMFRSHYDDAPDEATIRRHLAAPISIRARVHYEALLQKLLAVRGAAQG
jgi:MOSC domain-containing protein YiiM